MATKARTSKASDSARLDIAAWINAAQTLLSEEGIAGVRVEPLARRLGVTKGSFYWHFKDRDALLEGLLSDWRRRATLNVMDRIDRTQDQAPERLRQLLRLPLVGRSSEWGANLELSIRLWGRQDKRAQAALKEVDTLRLRYISGLVEACGIDKEESNARAVLAYAYMRVAATLLDHRVTPFLEQCEDILIRP